MHHPRHARRLVAAALFVNAFLLFALQPHLSRRLLPLLGGGADVWTACSLFFQLALLVGYAGANLTRRWPVARTLPLHALALATALLFWPFDAGEGPPPLASPVWWTVRTLVVQVGWLFVTLSATSPLLQLASSRADPEQDPYSLFAASNAGSLSGLLAYPLLLDPLLSLREQAEAWRAAAVGLLVVLVVTAVVLGRANPVPAPAEAAPSGPRPTIVRRLRWLGLATVPSVLLLAVTALITTDIAPMPLLWMIPLCLYLGSFIRVFSAGWRRSRWTWTTFAMVSLPTLLAFGFAPNHWGWIAVHLAVLWCGALLCHGALVDDRPDPSRLTEFYLWLAAGGALGALLTGVVAPLVFTTRAEYPLAIVAACWLARPDGADAGRFRLVERVATVIASVVAFVALGRATAPGAPPTMIVAFALLPALAAVLCWHLPRQFAVFCSVSLLAAPLVQGVDASSVLRGRTFYGTWEIRDQHGFRTLSHGTTLHGAQWLQVERRGDPISYYGAGSPIADIFRTRVGDQAHVAIVGLGAGVILDYARAGSSWRVFEIDEEIARIATDGRWFTCWADAAVRPALVIGDGRLRLRDEPDGSFDLIVLDAFASDAVPTHLLTREAIELYRRKLRRGGAVALNVSNRYVDLAPVLSAAARRSNLQAWSRVDSRRDVGAGAFPSRWVLLDDNASSSAPTPEWTALEPDPSVEAWSDDHANVLAVLRPFRPAWSGMSTAASR